VHVRDAIDVEVIRQVFLSEDYCLRRLRRHEEIYAWPASLQNVGKHPLILDLGANTGLASLYFAREFPQADVIALEPDPGNAATAVRNLRDRGNVRIVQGGISSASGRANIINPGEGNWSYRTELSSDGSVAMYTVDDLISQFSRPDNVPFIIKIDIEGSEADLFSRNTDWIDRFPVLVIELHDWMLPKSANSGNFLQKISGRNRDFIHIGENVFSLSNDLWPEA
jgi:FkbM family methyltransferase